VEARVRLACIGLPQMKPTRMPPLLSQKINEISQAKTHKTTT